MRTETEDLARLAAEVGIVWLVPEVEVRRLPYVRESTGMCMAWEAEEAFRRLAEEKVEGYHVLAHSTARPDHREIVEYREWWLKEGDRIFDPVGAYQYGHPAEAVDPGTIRAGYHSIRISEWARMLEDFLPAPEAGSWLAGYYAGLETLCLLMQRGDYLDAEGLSFLEGGRHLLENQAREGVYGLRAIKKVRLVMEQEKGNGTYA